MSAPLPLTPARIVTLVVGVPIALAVIGYTALGGLAQVAQASYHVAGAISPTGQSLTVRLGDGDLTLRPSSDAQIHLSGTAHYSLVRPQLGWRATPTGITLKSGCGAVPGNCVFDYTVAVPAGIAVTASSGNGNLTAVGLTSSDVTATSRTGDVSLAFARPPVAVKAHSGSGQVTVSVPDTAAYSVVASASAGSTQIRVRTDPSSPRSIRASSGAGDVRVLPATPG